MPASIDTSFGSTTEAILRIRRLCGDHPAFRTVEIDNDALVIVVSERNPDPAVDEWELIEGTSSNGWPVRVEVRA